MFFGCEFCIAKRKTAKNHYALGFDDSQNGAEDKGAPTECAFLVDVVQKLSPKERDAQKAEILAAVRAKALAGASSSAGN